MLRKYATFDEHVLAHENMLLAIHNDGHRHPKLRLCSWWRSLEAMVRPPAMFRLLSDGHAALDKVGVPPNPNLLARMEWLAEHTEFISIDMAALTASYEIEDSDGVG